MDLSLKGDTTQSPELALRTIFAGRRGQDGLRGGAGLRPVREGRPGQGQRLQQQHPEAGDQHLADQVRFLMRRTWARPTWRIKSS